MPLTKSQERSRTILISLAFALFSIILIGLFWLATTPDLAVGLALSYAAGLSMIFLPCTLPLVFIIVPLSMGKGYKKGLGMAVLFGMGVTITLALYGVAVAVLGAYLGLDQVTRVMFVVAGVAAFIFGLSMLKLIRWQVPGFGATAPGFIARQRDYLKALLLGLFMGNAGIGCPNPAFYVLLLYIATLGSITAGGWLGFIHGLGRATPLIFLSILAILGVKAGKGIASKRFAIEKISGWALILLGGFMLVVGGLGMHWWEDSVLHITWQNSILGIAPNLAEAEGHPVFQGLFNAPLWVGWAALTILFIIPLIWDWRKGGEKHES